MPAITYAGCQVAAVQMVDWFGSDIPATLAVVFILTAVFHPDA
jgi:hypothetical protein